MTPWVVNIVLAIVLVLLLLQRRTRRFSTVAAQGLGSPGATSVLAAYRVVEGPDSTSWEQGTLTRERSGDYLWTPGGEVTAQRLGVAHVTQARACGWWEGVWALGTDWVVLRCAGLDGTGGAAFEVAARRPDLERLPELARYAATR
jgi:hypothetical protein